MARPRERSSLDAVERPAKEHRFVDPSRNIGTKIYILLFIIFITLYNTGISHRINLMLLIKALSSYNNLFTLTWTVRSSRSVARPRGKAFVNFASIGTSPQARSNREILRFAFNDE